MPRKKKEYVPHPRYDPRVPLLRELVRVHVDGDDGLSVDVLLTRIPGIGEEIVIEGQSYRIHRVQHDVVDDDGRAFGWHAFVDAEHVPEEERRPRKAPW